MTGLLGIVIAYLLGSIPFGYLLTKIVSGKDVRTVGSGNIGATNVVRAAGRGVGVATLVLDAAKGYAAVWIAGLLTGNSEGWMADAALAVMAGHAFPIFLSFKGGKAVASALGAFVYLAPLPILATAVVFIITVAVSRYISAGSVMAAGTFPVAVWLILHPSPTLVIAALVAGGFIVYRHKENLERIHAGTERAFRWSGS